MHFGLQHDLPGYDLDAEWRTLLAEQAGALEAILTRVADTVTAVTTRPDQIPGLEVRLHILLAEAERFLTTMAQQNVGIERGTAYFQASNESAPAASREATRRLQVIAQVNAALHANLTTARRALTEIAARVRK